ncbi:MAG TPA: DUF58 domain-containing protein [Caldithrix abyssi]|uniref:DUF58 domain-containing protein n=1 Tax=Caldithrix abyssi TaxID=187145 RepID=A0A7V5RQ97_CALAY|nr:DUF58 domain-containing protein [Caldithrix abyssi]
MLTVYLVLIPAFLLALGGLLLWASRSGRETEKLNRGLSREERTREILKKVRQIDVSTRAIVNELFAGEYHSVFKGRGMEFAEVREYQPGDDVRIIDWNVSARTGKPFVKIFDEERELTVMLLVDVSSSGDFGTARHLKREVAAEISAVLAFSAISNNDKVGLIIFSDKIEKYIPPRKGKKHVLRVIREVLFYEPGEAKTDLNVPLEYLSRIVKRRSTAFLISDFLARDFEKSLQLAAKKHDLIAMNIIDPREVTLPDAGLVELEDAESGERLTLDTGASYVRNGFHKAIRAYQKELRGLFRSTGVDHIEVLTDRSYVEPINRFFKMRARRKGALQ